MGVVRFLAGTSLLVLPGFWLRFLVPAGSIRYAARIAICGSLAPLVVVAQFYAVRLAGMPFSTAVWFLVAVNAAAIFLVPRRGEEHIHWPSAAKFALVFLFLVVCVGWPWLVSERGRVFGGHNWMHMGILYQFPSGALLPEEPELAGIPLAYPWLCHVFWAVMGAVMGWAPTQLYLLTNLVWLLWTTILVYELGRSLGASSFASRIGVIWVALGTNVVGVVLWYVAGLFGFTLGVPGDGRTTPWVRKFWVLNEMVLALALFSALLLVSIFLFRRRSARLAALAGVLLAGTGLMHPLFFPAALALCVLLGAGLFLAERREGKSVQGSAALRVLVGAVLLACAVVLAHGYMIGHARAIPLLRLSDPVAAASKFVTGFVATALFLAAIASMRRRQLTSPVVLFLLAGAACSLLARVLVQVGAGYNEYKFIFTAVLCLAPVAALGIDRWAGRWRIAPALVVIASTLMAATVLRGSRGQITLTGDEFIPAVRESGFLLEVAQGEPDRGWIRAIRDRTPADTVVVTNRSALWLPAITQRALWAPPDDSAGPPGYWLTVRWNLVDERGYAPKLLESREALLRCLYQCENERELDEVDQKLKGLHRPLAIVFHGKNGRAFLSRLQNRPGAHTIHADAGVEVVLVDSPTVRLAARER